MGVLIAVILFLIYTPHLFATERSYYSESKCGYWWYEVKKEEKEKLETKEERKLPSLKDYPVEKLWTMYPDDFQALLLEFQKKAVQNPSEENVLEYYRVQDIARRKALTFANVTGYVLQKHPDLSLAHEYPITAPGQYSLLAQKTSELEGAIKQGREDFALLYFYSSACPYCDAQEGILSYFMDKYGWRIKKIDRDTNPSLAVRFAVETVPAIMLIYKGSGEYMPISVGVVSLSDIEERLYRGMKVLLGEMSPEQWSLYEFQRGGGFDPGSVLKK